MGGDGKRGGYPRGRDLPSGAILRSSFKWISEAMPSNLSDFRQGISLIWVLRR